METRICKTCQRELPATTDHFYKLRNTLHKDCKDCYRLRYKDYRPKKEAVHKGEILAINRLMTEGIFATSGKSSVWGKFIDVVAWGCIRIEVKFSTSDSKGRWLWTFASTKNPDTPMPDFILLIGQHKDESLQYFMLPANHPAFFKDGKRKSGMTCRAEIAKLTPSELRYKPTNILELWNYENAFHQIETLRLDKIKQMKAEHAAMLPIAA